MIVKVKTGEWRMGYGKTIPAIYQPKNREVYALEYSRWNHFLRVVQLFGRYGTANLWPDESVYLPWLEKRMEWIYNAHTMPTKGTTPDYGKRDRQPILRIKWIGNYYGSGLNGDNRVNVLSLKNKNQCTIATLDPTYAPNPYVVNPVNAPYYFGRANYVNKKGQPIKVGNDIWDGAILPLISRNGVMTVYNKHLEV